MPYKISYKRKLFFYYFSVFLILTLSFVIYQYDREKQFRILQLDNTLNSVTNLTHNYIDENALLSNHSFDKIDSLLRIVSIPDLRVTIVENSGKVLYDNFVKDYDSMENHLHRPEIQKAKYSVESKGENIRHSKTTGQNFYYYAHEYENYYIRAAVVYNVKIKHFLQAERVFLIFIVFIFIVTWIVLSYVTQKFSYSITKLKDFSVRLRRNENITEDIQFPNDELGVISNQIVSMYKNITKTKNALSIEKEKLIKHLYVLNEGVGFFSRDKKSMLTNSHFVQYLNLMAEKASILPEYIFEIDELSDLLEFVTKYVETDSEVLNSNNLPQFEKTLHKSGYYFSVKCIIFPDKSFEVNINDRTKLQKRKILKQQMTSNIAHELKTPVSSVSGYLETILNNPDIDNEKKNYFLNKAYRQAGRLSALIEDIVVLNKIEEADSNISFEKINLKEVVLEIIEFREGPINALNNSIFIDVSEDVVVLGNRSLIISIFQNLIDNALKYAGENISIHIKCYHEDNEFYYFSFIDNGVGIPEDHIARIFERFYRVDTGRSRKLGGTGLGLSIVKNAVNLHKGEVSVKNGAEGGLEFYFNLPKA